MKRYTEIDTANQVRDGGEAVTKFFNDLAYELREQSNERARVNARAGRPFSR